MEQHKRTFRDGNAIIEIIETKVGRAEKINGTWNLEPWGGERFHLRGKHMCMIPIKNNLYLDCACGGVWKREENRYEPEYVI